MRRNERLATQLMHELMAQISSGAIIGEEGRLPSEGELSDRYSVSRATVREALTKMELAGIVIRRQGVGTFVNHMVQDEPGLIHGWLDEAPRFVDLIAASGQTPDVRVLSVTEVPAGGIAEPLNIMPDDPVVAIEKIFLADHFPVIYSWTVISRAVLGWEPVVPLTSEDYAHSTYQLLEEQAGRRVEHQRSEVRAVVADTRLATLLQCQPRDPLLHLEEIAYDQNQSPLFYALHYFRGDRVSFRQVRVPKIEIRGGRIPES